MTLNKAPKENEQETFVSDRQLAERYDVNRASIWRWAKDRTNSFPKPVQLGPQITRWKLSDILAFEAAKSAAA